MRWRVEFYVLWEDRTWDDGVFVEIEANSAEEALRLAHDNWGDYLDAPRYRKVVAAMAVSAEAAEEAP